VFEFRQEQDIFLFTYTSHPPPKSTQQSVERVSAAHSPEIKQAGRETDK
jgi:hypothetical protein